MLINYNEYRRLMTDLIDNRQSFEIVAVPSSEMFNVCSVLENYIEQQHLKCRVYTQKRLVSGAAGWIAQPDLRDWGISGHCHSQCRYLESGL